jgi:small subunit ribosomal protein S15
MAQKVAKIPEQTLMVKAGSTEAQISFLTKRVIDLSAHLNAHSKDYASQRGLRKVLGKRKRLLKYLAREDAVRYERLLRNLGFRGLKHGV